MPIRRCIRLLVGTGAVAALLLASGPARATCDANGLPIGTTPCYRIAGSDTLFEIMRDAIAGARAQTTNLTLQAAANNIFYAGGGSGTAETALATPATATDLGTQTIGPMSRNFRPNRIDPGNSGFTQRTTANVTTVGHFAWAPTIANVVGLDAAVFVVSGSSNINDISFRTETEPAPPAALFFGVSVPVGTATEKAVRNNAGLPGDYANSSAFNNLSSNVNYSNLMMVVLGGVDGSGTLAACSDVRRTRALADLAFALGVTTLEHIIRRDDASGTTDTFKDRIIVVPNVETPVLRYASLGGRFCNGAAPGNTAANGICELQTAGAFVTCPTGLFGGETVCAGGLNGRCLYNRGNQDFDPIRRACLPASASAFPTSCSDYVTGLPCSAGDGNPNCSQGLVVGLSDTDPGQPDITISIANRVANGAGVVMGYAGRTSVDPAQVTGTKAPSINTLLATPENTRSSQYLLARKLFIQYSGNGTDSPTIAPGILDSPVLSTSGAGARKTDEATLWNGFLRNRLRMDPIINGLGFISCLDPNDPAYGTGDPTGSSSLCAVSPSSPVSSPLSNNLSSLTLAAKVAKTIRWDGASPAVVTTGTVTAGWQDGRLCTTTAACTCTTANPCLSSAPATYTTPTCANSVHMTCSDGAVDANFSPINCTASPTGGAGATLAQVSICVTGRCTGATPACTLGNVNVRTGAAEAKALNAACTVDSECGTGNLCRDRYGFGSGIQARGRVCCSALDSICAARPAIAPFP